MQHKTPIPAGAPALLAHFAQRGVKLTVEYVRESDDTHWWRVWLRGGQKLPGDFEAINQVKPELVDLLRASGQIERGHLPQKRRRLPKSRTPIWSGPAIPPIYRSILAEMRSLN